MSIKKTSIQQAILEAREIEKIATEKARKAIEEEMAPKIRQVANEALRDFENQSLNEGMNLEVPDGAEVSIKMPGEGVEEVNSEISDEASETENDTEENEIADTENLESDEITNNDEEEMSDIFEIEGLFEADDTIQPDANNAPMETPAPAPAPDVNAAPEPTETPTDEPASLEVVSQKLDDVLAKLSAIASEETSEQGNEEGEGDVSIIEDEPEVETANLETPAPAPAPAEAPIQEDEMFFELDNDDEDESIVYEVEDDTLEEDMVDYELEDENDEIAMEDFNEKSMMEMFNEIQGLNELEIVDEDEEELDEEDTMEEMLGVGQNLRHSNKLASLPRQGVENRKEINESINKVKAQYGSKIDEQNQEIDRLKQTIKEYKDSFIVLRKQINEVQIFNAKLAYANKLFTNGGLTNDEKMKIAEEFDSVSTIEEAKKLYNNLLNEMKGSKSTKTPTVEKLKSVAPAVIKTSNVQTLYESDEMRRMKRLAGIGKNSEE